MPVSEGNLAALSARYGINAMVNYFNGELGNDINDLVIQDFYNNYLLDAIELSADNYVFQGYAKPYYVPEGYGSKKLKRYGSLTEHTTPLVEGVPPKSDKTRVESFEATYNTYGRYMEFTDRIDYMTIDPIIVKYGDVYGRLAARTKERLARNEMLHSTSVLIPININGKVDLTHMNLHDHLTLNDYRVQVAKMKRMLVEPVEGGNFHLIGSPEVKFDLFTDPLVKEFYGTMAGIASYQTGELPVLFNIRFKETMLDDYAYGYELANPGELDAVSNGKATKILRIYWIDSDSKEYYLNVPADYRKVVEARLSDGSYIPEKVEWDVKTFLGTVSDSGSVKVDIYDPVAKTFKIDQAVASGMSAKFKGTTAVWKQLPVHRCILIGADALIETGIEGHTDAKMYIKPLGSAGVLDPIDQRQSIGFKIDTLGYSLLKPESCVVCYTIPSGADDINTTMYTYVPYGSGDEKVGKAQMKYHSYTISGNKYTQLQTEEGYNQYGKLNPETGNVDVDRPIAEQSAYYNGLDEFTGEGTEENNPNKE